MQNLGTAISSDAVDSLARAVKELDALLFRSKRATAVLNVAKAVLALRASVRSGDWLLIGTALGEFNQALRQAPFAHSGASGTALSSAQHDSGSPVSERLPSTASSDDPSSHASVDVATAFWEEWTGSVDACRALERQWTIQSTSAAGERQASPVPASSPDPALLWSGVKAEVYAIRAAWQDAVVYHCLKAELASGGLLIEASKAVVLQPSSGATSLAVWLGVVDIGTAADEQTAQGVHRASVLTRAASKWLTGPLPIDIAPLAAHVHTKRTDKLVSLAREVLKLRTTAAGQLQLVETVVNGILAVRDDVVCVVCAACRGKCWLACWPMCAACASSQGVVLADPTDGGVCC